MVNDDAESELDKASAARRSVWVQRKLFCRALCSICQPVIYSTLNFFCPCAYVFTFMFLQQHFQHLGENMSHMLKKTQSWDLLIVDNIPSLYLWPRKSFAEQMRFLGLWSGGWAWYFRHQFQFSMCYPKGAHSLGHRWLQLPIFWAFSMCFPKGAHSLGHRWLQLLTFWAFWI